MLANYEKLLDLKCFSHKDAMQLFGDARRTTNILYAMKKKGLIRSVRRDCYAVVSLKTRELAATPFEIASRIAENTWISHLSAFEYYGAADHRGGDVWVSSETSFREFEFDGCRYHCLSGMGGFGILEREGVRVTDLERTILDGIRDMGKLGGPKELAGCLERMPRVREQVMMDYLERYQNQFLYQKAGYLLSYFPQMGLTEAFFDCCRCYKGQSSRYLDGVPGTGGCTFLKEWNLCVPEDLLQLMEERGIKEMV